MEKKWWGTGSAIGVDSRNLSRQSRNPDVDKTDAFNKQRTLKRYASMQMLALQFVRHWFKSAAQFYQQPHSF